jgi:xylose dehydrogenase (NAD/NADP)
MAERVRWGILGNAAIARVCVIPAIQRSRNGRVVVLGTRRPDHARELARTQGIARVVGDYEEVLADPEVEAVYLPLPNHLHHPWALRALAAGKHVLCEKPLACKAAEARSMAAAAREAGRHLMEALMYRFHPRSLRIRQLVAEGELGPIRLVRAAFCYRMDPALLQTGAAPRLQPNMGGGALLDVGCYGVSLARWLLDDEPTHVQAQALYHPGGVDLHLVGSLRFGDRALAGVEASFLSALQQTYSVLGETGAVDLPHDAFIPWERETFFLRRGSDQQEGKPESVAGADEYRLMVEHFGDMLTGRARPGVTLDDSIANLQVLDALAQAAGSGRTVVPDRTTAAAAPRHTPQGPHP